MGTLERGLDGTLERPPGEQPQADDPEGAAVLHHGQVPEVVAEHDPGGILDRRLEPPSVVTTSLCFDGPYLYVTTGNHTERPELRGCVLRARLDVPGVPRPVARV